AALDGVVRAARRAIEQTLERSMFKALSRNTLKPRVRVSDTENALEIVLELPEVEQDSVSVTLDGEDVLHISARAPNPELSEEPAPAASGVRARALSTIERTLVLPRVFVREKATATFDEDRLTVTLPKKTRQKEGSGSQGKRAA